MGDETHNSLDGRAETAVQARDIGVLHVHGATAPQAPAAPHQLPAASGYFEDRRAELARIVGAVEGREGDGGGPLVLVLTGMGGIGKTTLAQHAARTLAARFPDGILYVDLDDGRRDGIAGTSDAVDQLLVGLRVDPKWWERGFAARVHQYWSRTHGKRLLVLIDNARYEGEATPLLPASPDSVALVLAPAVPADLLGPGVVEIPVPPLPAPDAVRLLGRYVGEARHTAEPEALAALARGCEGLPAALTVAGRWAARRSRRRALSPLVAELTGELREKGIPMVEAVWDASYGQLADEAARLYRLLAQLPSSTVRVGAAAALLGTGAFEAEAALDELETAGLLLPAEDDAFRLHALLRGHAGRVAHRADPDGTEAARARAALLTWYRRQAARADVAAAGPRMTFAPVPPSPAPDLEFPDANAAHAWLRTERHALYGAVSLAFETGRYEDAWALCEPLWTHFMDHRNHAEITEAFRTGLAAADREENTAAMTRMRAQLAYSLWEQGEFAEAEDLLSQALGLTQGLGATAEERKLHASVLEFGGLLLRARGDHEGAATAFRAARAAHARTHNAYGELLATYQLARTLLDRDEPEQALPLLRQTHRQAREAHRARLTARTALALAQALRRTGDLTGAAPLLTESLEAARARRSTKDETEVLGEMAQLAEAQGDTEGARAYRDEAAAVTEREGGTAE